VEIKHKQRIVGAVVIVALLAISVPLIFRGAGRNAHMREYSFDVPKAPTPSHGKSKLALNNKQEKAGPAKRVLDLGEKEQMVDGVAIDGEAALPSTEISAGAVKSLTPKAWVVQLASFARQTNASTLAKELRDKGFAAYTQIITTAGGKRITRVLVGPEVKRDKAQKLLVKLQQVVKMKGILIVYDPLNT